MAYREKGKVGLVLGTEDATPLEFWVSVGSDSYLQLDDVIALERHLPGVDEPVRIYGVVSQVRARQDGVRFDADVHMVGDGTLPAFLSESAQVMATRFEPEVFVPPHPGQEVSLADEEQRNVALFFDQMGRPFPAGISRDGQTMSLNFDFVDGTRGAHINISGVSGIATKTTYATFLLHSIFTSGVLGANKANTQAVIFNAKGEDLLFLDRANVRLDDEGGDSRDQYQAMGLPAAAFSSVEIWTPPKKSVKNRIVSDAQSRTTKLHTYVWTLAEFCEQEMLPYLFVDAEDERAQYTTTVATVTAQLKKHAKGDASGSVTIDGHKLVTFGDLLEYIAERVEDETDQQWRGRAIGFGTGQAFVRRMFSSQQHIEHLIRGGITSDKSYSLKIGEKGGASVKVVDIHNLHDRARRFVVGVLLRKLFAEKELTGAREPLTFVVLDELNRYAPQNGRSPIKETLLDIAERGRSLGIILIGAQQTASEVERRIVSNCAVKVVGRLDSAEASREQYAWLPGTHRDRATILKPGTMLLIQPQWPVPSAIQFPFPAWATRSEEAEPDRETNAEGGDDGFGGLVDDGETYYDDNGDPVPF